MRIPKAAAPFSSQTCDVNTNALDFKRRIGYYCLPSTGGPCKRIDIENLEVAPLTDVNLAYVNFSDDFKLATAEGSLIYRASLWKLKRPALRVSISIGGRSLRGEPTNHWSRSVYPRQLTREGCG